MEYSIVYILLGLTSLVGLAFVIERGIVLQWRKVVPPEIETAVQSCYSRAKMWRCCNAFASRNRHRSAGFSCRPPISTGPKRNLKRHFRPARDTKLAAWLERGLVVLEVIVGIAPRCWVGGPSRVMTTLFGDIAKLD